MSITPKLTCYLNNYKKEDIQRGKLTKTKTHTHKIKMEFLALIVVVCLGVLAWSQLKRKGRKLPPGPYPLPIVGNIFQVQPSIIHRSLAQLAKKYGPLMSIRLGSKTNIIISSPEMAKEVMTNQSSTGRPMVQALYSHDHINFSITFLPTDNQKWKDMRKICKEQIFANHSLEKSQWLRHKKHLLLIEYVQKCYNLGRAVNIRQAAFTTTLNLISATLFSVDAVEFDSSAVTELKDIVTHISASFGAPNYADYFPILKSFDPQGLRRDADLHFGRLFRLVQTHIDQRLESRRIEANQKKHNDLLETLLDSTTPGSGYNLTLHDVKHLLFDLYFAGSDSTAMTIEWIMTELLNHPVVLSKAKDEMRSVMGDRKTLHEADISRLPYLQAVTKEVFRFHPIAPLLPPRKAIDDIEINGYFIPKGTSLFFNMWAIGRDPSIWRNPESFEPERFLNDNNIDLKGQNFELIPFGSGRRICPGMPLADRTVHTTVAALIHNFDWKFAPGQSELNGEMFSGQGLFRKAPLMAIPMKP